MVGVWIIGWPIPGAKGSPLCWIHWDEYQLGQGDGKVSVWPRCVYKNEDHGIIYIKALMFNGKVQVFTAFA